MKQGLYKEVYKLLKYMQKKQGSHAFNQVWEPVILRTSAICHRHIRWKLFLSGINFYILYNYALIIISATALAFPHVTFTWDFFAFFTGFAFNVTTP